VLRTYFLLITILYSIVLTAVCLIDLNGVIEVKISFGDKIFHSLAYVVLTFLWYYTFYYNLNFNKGKALIYAVVISIIFGIVIEVLQGTVTTYRSSDINDVFANSFGAILAAVVIAVKNKYILK
jgi:glycopeptide antibiotics resistance protein